MTTLAIAVEPGRAQAVARRWGRVVWAAEAPFTDEADLGAALAALAAERPPRLRRTTVTLAEPLARVKTVADLPRLARGDLAAHVQLHSRRYFLQNGVPLVTDAEPRRHGAVLAAAPLPLITAVCDGLAAAGLACTDLSPAAQATLSLLPAPFRTARGRAERRVLLRWASAAAASLVLAGAAWGTALLRAERSARAELARLENPLAEALALRRDLDAATAALGVLGAAAGRTGAATFLADLARALPDSAFLLSLRLEADGQVLLTGYAVRAASVAAALERARLLRAPAFEGPVTRETVNGRQRERFTLRGRRP